MRTGVKDVHLESVLGPEGDTGVVNIYSHIEDCL